MQLLIGKVIDNYRIDKILGKGGMGIVYQAMDLGLEKIVALKTLDPKLAQNKIFLKKFRSEAKSLARAENHNIVNVYALRDTKIGLVMVMEYIDGETLADMMRRRKAIPYTEALSFYKQFLRAIHHAHQVGVIHRDIKPNNMMINRKGIAKVTDFGLAKILQGDQQSTISQGVAGTLRYMSPEQVKGDDGIDHRTDIYSLGMTFYEILAGRTPFEKKDSEFTILKKIVERKLPVPSNFNQMIPKPLEKIIMKAIEKEREKRFHSVNEMLQAIEHFEVKQRKTINIAPSIGHSLTKYSHNIVFALAIIIVLCLFIFMMRMLPPIMNPPMQHSTLSILTNPQNAEIFLNRKTIGKSPYNSIKIKSGNVKLSIKKQNFFSVDTVLNIQEGQHKKIILDLKPIAWLAIQVKPVDAKIILNGEAIPFTRLNDLKLHPGHYDINILHEEYLDIEESFNLIQGFNSTLRYQLEPIAPSVSPDIGTISTRILNNNPR